MRLDITGRHVDITPPLRQLIERRLARLERVLNDSIVSIKVILTLEKYRHRTEIAVHTRGDHVLRGNGEANSWPLSIRDAADKIEQQATKLKGKWNERKRKSAGSRVVRTPAAEIAILFRINAQSEVYEQALASLGIPYLVRGGERFFDRPEVRQAMITLRSPRVIRPELISSTH